MLIRNVTADKLYLAFNYEVTLYTRHFFKRKMNFQTEKLFVI